MLVSAEASLLGMRVSSLCPYALVPVPLFIRTLVLLNKAHPHDLILP